MSTRRVSRVRPGHASRRTKLTMLALACALYQGAAGAAGVTTLSAAQAAPATQSAVADAVMRRDAAAFKKLISRADVNAAQPDGTTALHWAAYHRDTDTAK